MIQFIWDEHKHQTNQKKHGVSFEEAKSVFFDEYARLLADPDHSETEERYLLLGMSIRMRLLVVSHCYRENDYIIHFISARAATRFEQQQYQRFRR
jgi:uncharacterized DUF497 family protein